MSVKTNIRIFQVKMDQENNLLISEMQKHQMKLFITIKLI